MRERIVGMVLATDFGLHVKILSEFKMMVGKEVPVDAEGTAANVAAPTTYRLRKHGLPVFTAKATTMTDVEQLTVASMIIKVADLSYPTKGFDYSMIWIERCLEEFMEQGDREKERGLPVGYDRDTLAAWKAKSQVGFFSFMVKPMYEALDLVAPMTEQLTALDTLITHWQEKVAAASADRI